MWFLPMYMLTRPMQSSTRMSKALLLMENAPNRQMQRMAGNRTIRGALVILSAPRRQKKPEISRKRELRMMPK